MGACEARLPAERREERASAPVKALGAGFARRCYRRLSTAAPGASVVGSSRPANGLAAMRGRMSRAWRAYSNRCV
jgi:hypothetical protein